jgi:hypothetical protein
VQLPVLTARSLARFSAALAFAAAGPAAALAQETRPIHAAMVFNAEAGPIRTTACLALTERVYPASKWWETAPGEGSAEDRAFKAVIAAIKRKDRAALLKLTDPAQAKDTAQFERQATSFFQQFEAIQMLAVPRAYLFDGWVVFFGTFKSETQTAVVPLVFAHQAGDTFGFLPARAKGVTYTLVNDWFTTTAGPGHDAPAYCDEPAVKRATHRVALAQGSWRPSALLLTGGPLSTARSNNDAPGPVAPRAAQAAAAIDRMKAALKDGNVLAFLAAMTPQGAGQLKPWLETAPAAETAAYKAAFIEQQPFFVFDQGPLVVLYTKTSTGQVKALYFTIASDGRLRWTNSAYVTSADGVFKQGPLPAAAASANPFSALAVK